MVDDEYIELLDFLDDDMYVDAKKCECGAHHTNNRNLHSEWCPLYVPPLDKDA